MTSPVKSLSFRKDADGSVCIHRKVKHGSYKSVADFWFEIVTFVQFQGHLNTHSGYIFEVHKSMGENNVSKKCFVSCREMDSAKKFKNALNNALADCGGVFWEDVKDVQLQGLLKTMTRQYFLDDGKVQKAVTIVGRQPVVTPPKNHLPENDVYVFNESIQMNGKGLIIQDEHMSYVWMDSYGPVSSDDKELLIAKNEFKVDVAQVAPTFSWRTILDAAKPVFNVNLYQWVMMMAGAIACFHYPYSIHIADACPAPMAIGPPGSGKSTTIEIISKMLGSKVESQATAEVIQSLLWKTTIPLCWDDPTYPSTVKSVLAGSFDSKGKRTKGRGKEVPVTNVVLAVNFELDDDLRSFERIVPIVYNQPEAPEDSAKYRLCKDHLYAVSSTACIPWVIQIGSKLFHNTTLVDQQINYFRNKDPTLPPRVHKLYGLYKAIVHQILDDYHSTEEANAGVSVEEYEDYLKETFLPYVRKIFLPTSHAVTAQTSSFDDFCNCLRKSLEVTKTAQELKGFMKNDVQTRADKHSCLHVILPELLTFIKQELGPQGSLNITKLRKAISEMEGTSVDHSGAFGGTQRRCVKIPREKMPNDVLQLIDNAFGTNGGPQLDGGSVNETENINIRDMTITLAAEEEHNKVLMTEKKVLEEALHAEKKRCDSAEQRIRELEHDLASKERKWQAVEEKLQGTIGHLKCMLRKQTRDNEAVQSPAVRTFSQILHTATENKESNEEESNFNDSGVMTDNPDDPSDQVTHSEETQQKKRKQTEIAKLNDGLHKGIIQGKRSRKK